MEGGVIMAVESRHVNATLRLIGPQRETVKTLSRIRPNIASHQVENIGEAVQLVRGQNLGNAFLTITSELVAL